MTNPQPLRRAYTTGHEPIPYRCYGGPTPRTIERASSMTQKFHDNQALDRKLDHLLGRVEHTTLAWLRGEE